MLICNGVVVCYVGGDIFCSLMCNIVGLRVLEQMLDYITIAFASRICYIYLLLEFIHIFFECWEQQNLKLLLYSREYIDAQYYPRVLLYHGLFTVTKYYPGVLLYGRVLTDAWYYPTVMSHGTILEYCSIL